VPYLFTGKELDEETGLYYFGARYYDSRTSVWVSVDPALGQYLDGQRGLGGVFNPINLGLYTYTHRNPALYTDPDGEALFFGALVGAGLDVVVQRALIASGQKDEFSISSVFVSAAAGATGVGLATKIAQAHKLTTAVKVAAGVAGDAAVSAGSKAAKGEEITATGVASDVLLGQAGGKAVGNIARGKAKASPENPILERAADRAERIANNPKVGRPQARQRQAQDARQNQQGFLRDAEVRGGAVGSGAGQGLGQVLNPPKADNDQ
jgi:RHS repeat-associated protein